MSLNPQLYPPIPPVTGDAPRPFWSVIVPAYKPNYLAQALRGVMDQDPGPEHMEILVLDDHSPHELEPIVRQVCRDRAVYVRHPQNLGTYANENAGVTMSRGIWTHILNDDDWVLPGFYQAFRQSLENQPSSTGIASCQIMQVDSEGRALGPRPLARPTPGIIEDWIMQIGVGNPVHPIGVVVRRSTYEHLGGYYLKLNYCGDWEFYKRAAAHYDWWFEPQMLAYYRMHTDSVTEEGRISGEQIRNLGHCIEVSEQYLPADKREQIVAASREAYAAYALRVAARSLDRGDPITAVRQIVAGLEISKTPKTLESLSKLLAQPSAGPLRELLPEFFRVVHIGLTSRKS